MNAKSSGNVRGAVLGAFFTVTVASWAAFAGTTIDPANSFAYGANIGWMDWRGDTTNGAVIGEYLCSGYIYSANVGWICLGSGSPADSIQYQNNSAADFGVNNDGLGNLRGYAYGANVGWINFETNGAAKVDLLTGKLSGSVWSANAGWISLSNSAAYVQTDLIRQGALAPDGLPIAWLLQNFGTTNVNASADADGDGESNLQEYLAGTDPHNSNDVLKITAFLRNVHGANLSELTWNSQASRYYALQTNGVLAGGNWSDFLPTLPAGTSYVSFTDTNSKIFYRVRAQRPLVQ